MNTAPGIPPKPAQSLFTLKVICLALTLPAIFFFVPLLILQRGREAGTELVSDPALAPFQYIAIIPAVISVGLFLNSLNRVRIEEHFRKLEPARAIERLFAKYVICWALNDAVAIFGFLYVFQVAHDPQAYLPYMVSVVLLNAFMFPRIDEPYRQALARQASLGNANAEGSAGS